MVRADCQDLQVSRDGRGEYKGEEGEEGEEGEKEGDRKEDLKKEKSGSPRGLYY